MYLTDEEEKVIKQALITAQVLIAGLAETGKGEAGAERQNPGRFARVNDGEEKVAGALRVIGTNRRGDELKEKTGALIRIHTLSEQLIQSLPAGSVPQPLEEIKEITEEAVGQRDPSRRPEKS